MNLRLRIITIAGLAGALLVAYIFYTRITANNLEKKLLASETIALTAGLTSNDELEILAQILVFPKNKRILAYFINTDAYFPEEKEPIRSFSLSSADRFEKLTGIESDYRLSIEKKDLTRILNMFQPVEFFLETDEFYKDSLFQYPSGIQKFSGEQMMEFALSRPEKEGEYTGVDRLYRAESLLLTLLWKRAAIIKEFEASGLLPLAFDLFTVNLTFSEISSLINEIKGEYHSSVLEVPLALLPGTRKMEIKEQRALIVYKTFKEEMEAGRLNDDLFPVQVMNGTEEGGLAGRVKQALGDRGVQVLSVDNLEIKPLLTTVMIERAGNSFPAVKLQQLIKLPEERVFFRRRATDVNISFFLGTDFEIKKLLK